MIIIVSKRAAFVAVCSYYEGVCANNECIQYFAVILQFGNINRVYSQLLGGYILTVKSA